MQLQDRSPVSRIGPVDGMDKAQVIDTLRQLRKEFTDPGPAFTILLERPRGLEQVTGWSKLDSWLGKRQRLAVVARQQWLGVEGVEV